MASKVAFCGFLIASYLLFSVPSLVSQDDATCPQNLKGHRENALMAIFHLDQSFRDAAWEYRKYQETLYDPLWEAVIAKRDPNSKAKRIDGEVRYLRHRTTADQLLRRAADHMNYVYEEVETIERSMPAENVCGGVLHSEKPSENISQFNNCMELWNHDTEVVLLQLKRLLDGYQKKQQEFSLLLESRLTDNPGDHDTFEDQYYHRFFDNDLKTQINLFRLLRRVRDRFEFEWKAEKCCDSCIVDQKSRWDPVLSQVKPDAQGDSGVAGSVVNNARLKQAFERFDRENKKEDG